MSFSRALEKFHYNLVKMNFVDSDKKKIKTIVATSFDIEIINCRALNDRWSTQYLTIKK